MKFAIIAAGEGSRLAAEGINVPKPLVEVQGQPLVARLHHIFSTLQAEEVVIIANCLHPETTAYIRQLAARGQGAPIRLIEKTTPGSLISFYTLSPWLQGSDFCLTTVDTVFRPEEFAAYVRHFAYTPCDGLMAVTDYIDDEKPLYVGTDGELRITGFYDTPHHCRYISGGIYMLRPKALTVLQQCVDGGKVRMRDFQRALVEAGLDLRAYPFGKILDVDHAADIAKAEAFLRG